MERESTTDQFEPAISRDESLDTSVEEKILLDFFRINEEKPKMAFSFFYQSVLNANTDRREDLLKAATEYKKKLRFTWNKVKLRKRILERFRK